MKNRPTGTVPTNRCGHGPVGTGFEQYPGALALLDFRPQIWRSRAASLCTDDLTGEAPPVESAGIRQSRRRRDSHRAFAVREREDHLLGVAWHASEKRVAREHGIAAVHTDAADVVRHHPIHEPLV